MKNATAHEIAHFTHLHHIWWGAKTKAGQKRYNNKAQLFKTLCIQRKGMKILEVGAGDGEFTKRLIKVVLPESKIIATDVTPKVVERGRKKIKSKNLSFMVDDLNNMRFKKNTFDIICGISILHHVDTKKALKEIYRVLKKGGQIFFTEPNYLNPHVFLGLNIPSFRKRMEFSPDETAFARWDLNKMMKEAGFKTIQIKNYDFLHPKTPPPLIPFVERISTIAEKIPILKEISGSLVIYAQK